MMMGWIQMVWVLIFLGCQVISEQPLENKTVVVLGILASIKGSVNEAERVETDHATIEIRWLPTNISDILALHWTVQQVDEEGEVDILVLLDTSRYLLEQGKSLLMTNNTRLVFWSADSYSPVTLQYDHFYEMDNERFCQDPGYVNPTHFRSVYCAENYWTDNSDPTYVDRTLFPGPAALLHIVVYLNWKRLYIVYETVTERETTPLLTFLSDHGILYALLNIDHVTDAYATLLRIYNSALQAGDNIHFLVVCRQLGVKAVLTQANSFDAAPENKNRTVLSRISRWLVGLYGHVNRTCLQQHAGNLDHVLLINIPEVKDALDSENSTEYLFKKLRTVQPPNATNENYSNILDSLTEQLRKVTLTDVMSGVCTGSKLETLGWNTPYREFRTVGVVRLDGHVIIRHELFPNVRFGYNRKEFLISVIEYPPYVTKTTVNGSVRYSGYCITILKELAASLNFTYRLTESPDGNYGVVVNRSTMEFNGLIGQLQRREVDMVVGDIAVQKDREQVMDFTFPFYYGYTTVILKKPDPNRDKWKKLLEPFQLEVICLIGVALLVSSVYLNRLEAANPFYKNGKDASKRSGQSKRRSQGGSRFEVYSSTLLWMFGTLCNEGNHRLPTSTAGRTFVSFWWLFCLVIIATYSGNLIAFLAVTKNELPFNSLAEMAPLEGQYKWGLIGGTFWEQIFLTSEKSEFKAVGGALARFNRSDPNVLSKSQSFHLARVASDDNYAFIGDDAAVDVATSQNCNLIKIKERFLSMSNAFGFPDKSPHTKIFNEKMMAMHETGLLSIWKKQIWPDRSRCELLDTGTSQKAVHLLDVQSAFYVLAIGLVVSAVVLVIERVVAMRPCRDACKRHGRQTDSST